MATKKTLILFRHGKSDWSGAGGDHERPLNPRGLKASRLMGRVLRAARQVPDYILSSSATRARASAELAAAAGEWGSEIEVTDQLYDSEPGRVLREVARIDDRVNTLLLAGHEPTWSSLTSILIGGGEIRFPTAAMARVDFLTSAWSQIQPNRGELIWMLQPKFFTKGSFELGDGARSHL